MTRWFPLIVLVLIATACAQRACRASTPAPINSYTYDHLGHLGGGETTAYALNDVGQVVGSSRPAEPGVTSRAFLWSAGAMTDLGTLGGPDSLARAVNNSGQVAGWATTAGPGYTVHAFAWSPSGGMRDLGTLGGDTSWAYGINDAGQVVGTSRTAAGTAHAFLWQNGRMLDLGVPAGANESYAFGINPGGQVVGYVDGTGGPRIFRWTPAVPNGTTGTMVLLHPDSSYGFAIDGAGNTAGQTWAADGLFRPTLWDSAGAHVLPLLPTTSYGSAYGVNAGCVVGQNTYDYVDDFGSYTNNYAVIWDAAHGTRSLSALTGANLWLPQANGINASAQVAAGEYLLSPSPLPTRPADFRAVAGDGQVRLWWSGSSGASSYTLERSTGPDGPFGTLAPGLTGTSFADTAVVNGTTYYYRLCAVNEYGQVASDVAMATPVAPPPAPTGLTAFAGDTHVILSWNASAGAEWYRVLRSNTHGGPYEPLVDEAGYEVVTYEPGFADYYVQNGTTYYYVVMAVNAGGQSAYSNEANATPSLPPPPPAPTGLITAAGDRRVTVWWNGVATAEFYQVKRATVAGGPYAVISTTTATAFDDTAGLTNGTRYYYVVTAVNRGGESPASSEVSAVPSAPTLRPTNLTATAGRKKVALSWKQSATPGVTQNRVYRGTRSGGPYSLRATIPAGTAFSDISVATGVTYYYVVTAVSTGGESAFSNQASAKLR